MTTPAHFAPLTITLPAWLVALARATPPCRTDEEQVALAITLAAQNVARGTGGPFGAAVFEADTGRLVAAGVNLVEPQANAMLHAEVVALMFAQQAARSFTLASPPLSVSHVLATSCAPCALCVGAVHWSGVSRVLAGATRDDAMAIGFDEGPVFPASIAYLEARGVVYREGLHRDTARAVLLEYQAAGGTRYNA